MSPTTRVLIALATGLALGVAVSASGNSALQSIAVAIEPVGSAWINAIRMTVIPLVVSLLFVSMTRFPDIRSAGQLGERAVLVFVAFLIGSAVFAALIVPILFEWMPTVGSTAAALSHAPRASSAGLPVEGIGVLIAVDLVPDIFKTVSNVTGDMTAAAVLSRQHR